MRLSCRSFAYTIIVYVCTRRTSSVDKLSSYDNCQGKKKEEIDRELLLIMLICNSNRRKKSGSCLSGRSRMQKRASIRLSIYVAAKISSLAQHARTEKAYEEKKMFFHICFDMYVYIYTNNHLLKKHH